MVMMPDRWKEITPSRFPWELEALEYIRKALPDYEPYRDFFSDHVINEAQLLGTTVEEIKKWELAK